MAFGIFNKKQPPKPEKTPVKAKAPVKKAEAPKPAAPAPVVEEEGFSLDFTNYASPEEVEEILSPLTTETKSILNPAGLDFGALVGEAPSAPPPPAAPAPAAPAAKAPTPAAPAAKAPAPAAPAAKAPAPAAPTAPAAKAPAPAAPAAKAPAPSLADSMGIDFTSFVQKAEAMVEPPAAKAPPAAPAAKAPQPAPKPAAPAPAAKATEPPKAAPALKASDIDDTVDFAPPATLDFIPKPAVPPKKAEPAPAAKETDDTVDFTPLNFNTQTPKLQPRPVMAPRAVETSQEIELEPIAKAPASKAPPPAPKAVPPAARGPKSVVKVPKGPKSKISVVPAVLEESAPNSVLIVEVEAGKKDVPAVIEEAAMLFANGQTADAVEKLDQAIAGGKLKGWSLPAWLMRFDAYQQLGRKSEFEEKALDFIVKFERSPPAWVDAPADGGVSRPGSSANINLSGPLSAASANAFAQLKKAAEKQPKLRIDFAKLESIDKEGAKLLFDTLKSLRAAKKEVYISGEGQILNLLRSKAVTGDTHIDQSFWLLLLDLYQSLGMFDEFEEAAVDYAVTYEVSPPSWEARPKVQPPAPPKPEASGVRVSSDDSFRLQGEIGGQQDALFKLLTDYASKANPVVLDFAHVHRIDFVNAGRLAGVVEKVARAGKAIVLRSAGEMTIALFAVVGLHQHARIIPRK